MSNRQEKLFLIDGTALIYRAFYAFIRNPLFNSKGQNTSAIYGTVNMFLKLVEEFNPQHVAISFDRKEKTFRHKISEAYKANRPPAPDELHAQVAPIKEFFTAIGIADISKAGFEADDVLATLAENYKNDFDIVIVSGDKDFSQLIEEGVKLYDPKKDIEINEKQVQKKYGIRSEQFIDYLALCGDSADNIPGVKGIGPKGAKKLLNQFKSLDGIYENIENVSAKGMKNKLIEQKEGAYLSRKLVTIVKDIELDISEKEDFKFEKSDLLNGLNILDDYELKSIAKKIIDLPFESKEEKLNFEEEFNFGKDKKETLKFKTILTDTEDKFNKLLNNLKRSDIVALDTETTSVDPHRAELVGISLCSDDQKAYYIPLQHKMMQNLKIEFVLNNLKEALKGKLLVGHNIKYDYLILKYAGWKIKEEIFDTMLAHYLLNPTGRHSLANCALEEFEHQMKPITDLIGKGKKQITFDLVPTSQAAEYASEDAYFTYQLYDIYNKQLKENDLIELMVEIEIPLVFALADLERNGVFLNGEILSQISEQNQKRLGELTQAIYEIAGSQFNLNSPQQLSKVLFEDMGIKPIKKTKTGYSTNINVLEQLAQKYEIAKLIIEYRQVSKLESTYVKALPELIDPKTMRVHSSFNQTVASTGRLSSSNPNLQNIPIRTEMGKEIRKAFCAQDSEHIILAADYSQIELRILAMLSQDKMMIDAFRNGMDIHSQTAAIIYDKTQKEVTSEERRFAKIINFGLIYGMGAYRISQELDISRDESKKFITNYFEKFPTIKEYLNEGIEDAIASGYVSTIFGRKLYLPDLRSTNKMRVNGAKRVATNMPIQGSAADIIKIAMTDLYNKFKDDPDVRMIIQVHDELVFEIKKQKLKKAKEVITKTMENALPAKYKDLVPLKVDIGTGKNWLEAH